MDNSQNLPPGSVPHDYQASHRRARSFSQPVASHPVAGPSSRPDQFDFSFPGSYAHSYNAMPAFTQGYDEMAFARALLALQQTPMAQQQQMQPPVQSSSSMPPPPVPGIPNPTQALLAALPWLQYLQMQSQYGQQQQQSHQAHFMPPPPTPQTQSHPQQQPQQLPQQLPSFDNARQHAGFTTSPTQSDTSPPSPSSPTTNTPSPETPADPVEVDQTVIVEDKRRRNTAASARFRIKKKQWTLNLERTISELSSRVQELEGEAAELRRENGWLKEIVMLKSKRFGAPVPDMNAAGTSSSPSLESQKPPGDEGDGEESNRAPSAEEKGKERQSP
ncbi:hypothetical protein WOLCODRAFT_135037 [Wolfiporia cocos MD-104 SS10]|uniref:BZIP domain-containing protein n=1 Tax=Wolfiporia cocos (strain MD-104) TaxID=742152 RepID=A0A2H3J9G3_WOLCO|nr:hypothetical protein WOLCODRAFT_135037 [Wolfiporia cocos MD-104 SS10]